MKPKIAKVTKSAKPGPVAPKVLGPESRLDRHDFDIARLKVLIEGHIQNENMHGAEERKRLDLLFQHITALGDKLGFDFTPLLGWSKKKPRWF